MIAGLAVALALFLAWQLRDDLGYAFSSSAPVDLGDARTLAATGSLPLNRYVRLTGRPDRESAVILDTRGSWKFSQFFRLLGTSNRVFVSRVADPLPVDLAERDVFVGRLVPFRELSFDESIRRHFSSHVTATHFFRGEALLAALDRGAPPLLVSDLLGEKVTLGPGDALAIETARPGEIRLELPRERVATAEAARAAVERQGGVVKSVEAGTGKPGEPVVVVAGFPPEGRDRALSAIGDLDRRVRIRPARTVHEVRVADLTRTPEGLAVKKGGAAVPLAGIESIRSLAAVEIPADAVLLREGDRPRDHLRSIVIVGVLAAFAVLNVLALRRR